MNGRTTEPAYTISSPEAFGSGGLKVFRQPHTNTDTLALCMDFNSFKTD